MRNRFILLCDVPLVGMAAYGAFALRFDWFFPLHRPEFLPYLLAALVVKPAAFLLLGMYSRLWRYASVHELMAVLVAVSGASVAMSALVAAGMVSGQLVEFSRSVLVIDWLLTLIGTGGVRMAVRFAAESRHRIESRAPGTVVKRALVVGAGDAGTMVVRELRRNPQLGIEPIGFLDDDPAKQGKRVQGLAVIGRTESLKDIVEQYQVSEVIIAMPAAGGEVIRALSEACRQSGALSRIVPGVFELLDGQLKVSRL
jgi:FlaA1/EpsC-like NDP-sugar epimerase